MRWPRQQRRSSFPLVRTVSPLAPDLPLYHSDLDTTFARRTTQEGQSRVAWKLLPVKKVGDKYDFACVLNAGEPLVSTAGTFYLEWYEDGGRRRRAVRSHPREVKEALASHAQVVSLRERGVQVDDAPQGTERRQLTGLSIADVLEILRRRPPSSTRLRSGQST